MHYTRYWAQLLTKTSEAFCPKQDINAHANCVTCLYLVKHSGDLRLRKKTGRLLNKRS